MRRRVAAPVGAAVLGVAGLAACADSAEEAERVAATPRSLVAAVELHLGRPAKIAAPLYPVDLDDDRPERVVDGTMAVEVALDEEAGDNSHVRVVVTPDPGAFPETPCAERDNHGGCDEATLDDGAERRSYWQAEAPEEEPGYIGVAVRRGREVVEVDYTGQRVPADLPDSAMAGLLDDLTDLATDPDVGLTTSPSLVAAGEEIGDDVMLDWFGQGNGFGPPPGYDGEGAPEPRPRAVRATPLALAAAAAEVLGEDPRDVVPLTGEPGARLAVRLEYDAAAVEGADDVDPASAAETWSFSLAVYPGRGRSDPYACPLPGPPPDCALLEGDLGVAHLSWEELEPEEDPGVVSVLASRDDGALVSLTLTGPRVQGDPRDSALADVVERMSEVAVDEAVGARTSRRLRQAGADLGS